MAIALAAGSMLVVMSDEMISEFYRLGEETEAIVSVMVGFVIIIFFDVTLS